VSGKDYVDRYGVLSCMQLPEQMAVILSELGRVIERGVEGDVVEMGCLGGTASVLIGRVVADLAPSKTLHLYDSFEGLPEKGAMDGDDEGFVRGGLRLPQSVVEHNIAAAGLPPARIHRGWFKNIPDEEYPPTVAFALFDGDFYQSILDSFARVYPKVPRGGVICVHDYDFTRLPGVKVACDEFMHVRGDRAETREGVRIITKA
jgi:O-methyltransferase